MAKEGKTKRLPEGIARQHLPLAVAAHLAHTQLVPSPRKPYDAKPLSEMLDVIAGALARTATLYVTDPKTGASRQLAYSELEGARARRGAKVLVLKDGATLTSVSLRRDELRQAIAILMAVGLPGVTPPPKPEETLTGMQDIQGALWARYAELEEMLEPPLLPLQVERAKAAAVWIARHARQGHIANLAMQLMSALQVCSDSEDGPGLRVPLVRLRNAIEDTLSDGSVVFGTERKETAQDATSGQCPKIRPRRGP